MYLVRPSSTTFGIVSFLFPLTAAVVRVYYYITITPRRPKIRRDLQTTCRPRAAAQLEERGEKKRTAIHCLALVAAVTCTNLAHTSRHVNPFKLLPNIKAKFIFPVCCSRISLAPLTRPAETKIFTLSYCTALFVLPRRTWPHNTRSRDTERKATVRRSTNQHLTVSTFY